MEIFTVSKSLLYNKLLEDDLIQIYFVIMIGWPCIIPYIYFYNTRSVFCSIITLCSFLEAVKSWKEELVRGIFQLFWTSLVKMSGWIAIAHSNTQHFSILALVISASACESLTQLPIKHLQNHTLTEKCLIAAVTRLLYPH